MLVLGIDTSGKTASCALCSEDRVLAQNTFVTDRTHSQVILPMVKKMLSDCGKEISEVDGFAAVSGPGSYTGLRIGIAAVKGICFALEKKCVGISALLSLAYNFAGTNSVICSVMHARQSLVYTAMFRTYSDGSVERMSEDEIISAEELVKKLAGYEGEIICTGDYSAPLVQLAGDERIIASAPPLNAPLASSLCYAAMKTGFDDAEKLNAEYMQITKAEKDLQEKKQ